MFETMVVELLEAVRSGDAGLIREYLAATVGEALAWQAKTTGLPLQQLRAQLDEDLSNYDSDWTDD